MNQPLSRPSATLSPPCGEGRERTLRTFIAPCAPEPAGIRSARRPGAQRVRMQSATWGGFRHEQAIGAAATGDRSRSKGGFMERGADLVHGPQCAADFLIGEAFRAPRPLFALLPIELRPLTVWRN